MTLARAARAGHALARLGLGGALLLAAGCSASTTTGTGATVSTTPTSSAPDPVPTTSTPTPTTPAPTPVTSSTTAAPAATTTAVPSTTAAPTPSTPPTPSSVPTVSPSTCRSVGVRVIQGGAERGAEIAALQFTNTGTASCRLGGFPAVTLLRNGAPVGAPSQPSTTTARTLTLQPGDTVESLLRDFSSCQAPLSDAARVSVPGESTTAVRPIQLRACTLRVGPLGPPA